MTKVVSFMRRRIKEGKRSFQFRKCVHSYFRSCIFSEDLVELAPFSQIHVSSSKCKRSLCVTFRTEQPHHLSISARFSNTFPCTFRVTASDLDKSYRYVQPVACIFIYRTDVLKPLTPTPQPAFHQPIRLLIFETRDIETDGGR